MPAAVTKTGALYETLHLQPDATDDEVRIAYKKLALKWHPDRCQDNKEQAQEKFVEIQDAYLKILEERERHRKHKPRKKAAKSSHATHTAPSTTPSAASDSSSTSGRANTEYSNGTSSPRQESVPLKEEKEHKSRENKPHKPAAHDSAPRSERRSSSSRPSSEYSSASTSTPRRESVPLKEEKHHQSTPDQPLDPAQPVSKKLRKRRPDPPTHTHSSKPLHDSSSDDEELYPKKSHFPRKSSTPLEDTEYEFVDLADLSSPLHPLRTPKSKSRGLADDRDADGDSKDSDWVFPLPVTLEDMYEGASQHYRITRTLRSGKTQSVKIDVNVSPSWHDGSQIRVAGVGNERKDGSFQDIVFKVELQPHQAFTRKGDDLVMSVQVPWADPHTRPYPPSDSERGSHSSAEEEDEVYVKSLDGREYAVPIPRSLVEGADGTRVKGAGMRIRKHGKDVGYGDMIIKWEFIFSDFDKSRHRTSWQTFKRAIHLKR